MDSWVKFCKGLCYFGFAVVLMAAAYYVVPAIGRSIDRAAPANEIGCGAQLEWGSGKFLLGFSAKDATNVKDHPSVAAEDGHGDE